MTRQERRYLKAIIAVMKKTDPIAPSMWVVTGGVQMMTMSQGSSTISTKYFYEPNRNMNRGEKWQDEEMTDFIDVIYDAANRMTSYKINDYAWSSYTYNYMYQRVGKSRVWPSGAWSYVYDHSGNMIRESWGSSYSEYVYLGGHRIAMVVPSSWSQPNEGYGCSIVGKDAWKSIAANGLILIFPAMMIIAFAYRKNGRRIKGVAIILLLSGGVVLLSYISTRADPPAFSLYWYVNDHLDTPVKMVAADRSMVNDTKLDPLGSLAVSESGSVHNNFRFPGQYHDRETGMYYNWNRYYMPGVGRYNQQDAQLTTRNNPFSYAENNPITYFDYLGLDSCCSGSGYCNSIMTAYDQYYRFFMDQSRAKRSWGPIESVRTWHKYCCPQWAADLKEYFDKHVNHNSCVSVNPVMIYPWEHTEYRSWIRRKSSTAHDVVIITCDYCEDGRFYSIETLYDPWWD